MNVSDLNKAVFTVGLFALASLVGQPSAHADVVTDWNVAFEESLITTVGPTNQRGPRIPTRTLAIMHVAMFDAVNGIDRKYAPYLVTDLAPPGARAEAAAAQAAYTVLTTLLSAHQAKYQMHLHASLANLPGSAGSSQSIECGRQWGEQVALAVIAARAGDGSTTVLPPFVGETTPGFWRHAPLGSSPTAGYANLATLPFVISVPASGPTAFDPGPPYGDADRTAALASARYAADVNEVKARGGVDSSERSAADLELAYFIDAADVAGVNSILRSKVSSQARLVDTARAFALVNMTAFDASVLLFRPKYLHAFWRPFQAVQYADLDGNDATTKDPLWASKLPTPPHPEYPSAHVLLLTSMLQVIARLEGDSGPVELAVAPTAVYPGGSKSFVSMSALSDALVQGRIDIGFHFRETGEISQVVARKVGDHIADSALQPERGSH